MTSTGGRPVEVNWNVAWWIEDFLQQSPPAFKLGDGTIG